MPTDREIAEAATRSTFSFKAQRVFARHFDPRRVLAMLNVIEAARDNEFNEYSGMSVQAALDRLAALDRGTNANRS